MAGFVGDFSHFSLTSEIPFPGLLHPVFHLAPAACCRFTEPFRDSGFVSAVVLALLHPYSSLFSARKASAENRGLAAGGTTFLS